MPDYNVLAAELAQDPLGVGYASMSDQEAADSLNALTRTQTNPRILVSKLAKWAAKNGVRAKIESHAANNSSPVQSICLALRDLFQGLNGPLFSLADQDNLDMADALVAAGVLVDGQGNSLEPSLLALADSPTSRALELEGWGIPVTANDIAHARSL